MQKALLFALLQPNGKLKELQDASDFTQLMVLQEELKTAPFYDVWQEYLARENKPSEYYTEIKRYEQEVLSLR